MGRSVGGGTAWEPKPACITGFLGAGRSPPGRPEPKFGGVRDTGVAGRAGGALGMAVRRFYFARFEHRGRLDRDG